MLLHQNLLNISTVFSYEAMASIYFEICSLYSQLIYNPQDYLVQNSSREMKTLLDMIDNFCLISHSVNQVSTTASTASIIEESSSSIIIRIKFLINLLEDKSLFEICNKNMPNFQPKLINFFIYAYLNTSNNNNNTSLTSNANTKGMSESNSNLIEKELVRLAELLLNNVAIIKELNVSFSTNVEQIVIGFIVKYSKMLKNIQVISIDYCFS